MKIKRINLNLKLDESRETKTGNRKVVKSC